MTAGRKLAIAALGVVALAMYMAYRGAAGSWQYYVTVDECLTSADTLVGARIRVSGKVVPGSLVIGGDRREARFALEGTAAVLPVICAGPLPDNLAEGIEVVVEGRLEDASLLRGDKVLTRCASKYQSEQAAAPTASKEG